MIRRVRVGAGELQGRWTTKPMDPQQWVSARDALSAMLVRTGMPSGPANQAADQLVSAADRPDDQAGTRYLLLLNFQFVVEPKDGQYWIRREEFERVLALVDRDPTLAE